MTGLRRVCTCSADPAICTCHPQPPLSDAAHRLHLIARDTERRYAERKHAQALQAVEVLMTYIGEEPGRAGIQETPERVLKAWRESWGKGYSMDPPKLSMFPEPGVSYNEMVIVRDIAFYSTCEHHMAPFFGTCDIGYIPDPKRGILGISKLARVMEYYSRRLQVQERLTMQIADHLAEHVSPDVAVVMRASHMCMVSRGVQQPNAVTVTSVMKGKLFDATPRSEFLALTRKA